MIIKRNSGGWNFFVNPALKAGSASIFWCKEVDPAVVTARVTAIKNDIQYAVDIQKLPCYKAVFLKNNQQKNVILSQGKICVQLVCMGISILEGPVDFEFIQMSFDGIEQKYHTVCHFKSLLNRGVIRKKYAHPTDQFDKLLNCLIALDDWLRGEFHRETANKLYGKKLVDEEWPKGYLLSRVCRLKRKARELMRVGYLKLLQAR